MIYYLDLLDGTRYERGGNDPAAGIDCMGVCRLIGERAGLWKLPIAPGCTEEWIASWVQSAVELWEPLGPPAAVKLREGDVLLTRSDSAPAGAAIVVEPESRIALTSIPERGIVALPVRRLGARAVYRWKGPRP